MDPVQSLKEILEKKLQEPVTYENTGDYLYVYFVDENVKIGLRIWESSDHVTVQLGSLRITVPNLPDNYNEFDVLVSEIKKRVRREVQKRGNCKEDIAKEARAIVPSNVTVRRDGTTIGFFVSQDRAIEIAELLKKVLA